jgi:C_GCAxxG_C_C family probable redox protein
MSINEDNFKTLIDRAGQLAYDYEQKYFGCAQTTVAGLVEAFGLGGQDILRASTCLAAGIARRGKVCGALTGGLLIIGYISGRDDLEMFSQYQRGMDYGDLLYKKFLEEFGTDDCSEIQEMKFGRKFDLQNAEERDKLHKIMVERQEGCQTVTSAGARLAAEVIFEIIKNDLPFPKMMAGNRIFHPNVE